MGKGGGRWKEMNLAKEKERKEGGEGGKKEQKKE